MPPPVAGRRRVDGGSRVVLLRFASSFLSLILMPMARQPVALRRALEALSDSDADMARAIRLVGPLPDRTRDPGFGALLRIVIEQQLSVASANAIWSRFEATLGKVSPENVLRLDDAAMRGAGLSGPKIRYSRFVAEAVRDGQLDLDRLHDLADSDAVAHLVQVKGIGRWTAEIYLLFAMGRSDIWPAGDLALQEGVRILKGYRKRPDPKRMDRVAKPWTPHRGTAARVLWRFYGLSKRGALAPDGA